jgi:nitrogen fixation NifU-like protein
MTNINYILKVKDAKLVDIQKALQQAGIQVRSIIEVHKEEEKAAEEVIKRFTNPKNFGKIKNADAIGRVGNPRCGDIMKLYLKIGKRKGKEIIKDIKFHTVGCAAAIATSDIACDLVKGKTLKGAKNIDYPKIIKELGYLPPLKIHCSVLAKEGLRAAIEDYEKRKKKEN